MLARRGRTRPRLLLSLAYAGYSGRDLALTWTAASGHQEPFPPPSLRDRCGSREGTLPERVPTGAPDGALER